MGSFVAEAQAHVASCVETVNPHGQNVPPAGSTTLPGPNGGQNEDGFYLIGSDVGTPVTVVTGGVTFGPFPSGTVVKYTQAYYTVDIYAPHAPSGVLASSVSLAGVQARMPAGSPPLYVSSITYGRLVLFAFESEYSALEVGAALDFVYHGGVDVSGDVSLT